MIVAEWSWGRITASPRETGTSTTATTTSGVSTPSPVQTGIIRTCDEFYLVVAGDSCYDIAVDNDIELTDFYEWNPAVKNDCTGLQAEVYVCVGVDASASPTTTTTTTTTATTTGGISTPTPTQTGMIPNCGNFYFVQSGDGCWDLANEHGIELADFYAWNPAVKDDCSGLQANVYVCVGLA
ncbi:LysM peptidoglycan-binding domain-containing protein [Aspergillus stella-maris]|uniref:LysM peptidoglycan-binding domain-containing protein n=1 Tax=Aspergillus stella-maris TaxID=1810926 RepID=UPI003CCD60E7